jgi:quinol monooxygenase YgiN
MSDPAPPVVVTAYFHPRPDARDEVLAALGPAIEAVHDEPGCQLYAIHDAPDGSIVMLEKWDSAELLDAHGRGEPVARLNAALDGLLERPVEVTRLIPRPVGQPAKGAL